RHVHVEWSDDELTRIRYEMAPEESFGDGPALRAHNYDELMARDGAVLSFISANPDLLAGVDPDRVAAATKAMRSAMENFYNGLRSDKFSWTILAVATDVWAAKMFPELPQEQQLPRLWEAIFHATRATEEDPVGAWMAH